MKNISIDHMNKQIVMTSSFYKKAARVGTIEYEYLARAMRDFPHYEVKSQRKGDALTKEEAELFLIRSGNEEKLKEFRNMCNKVEVTMDGKKRKVYKWFHIRTWFYENCPEYKAEKELIEREGEEELSLDEVA